MSRIDQIRKMLAASPEDLELHYMLAMEHRAAGEYDVAIATFEDCIRRDPAYAPAYFQKANTLVAAGRLDDARTTLHEGIARARAAGDEHAAGEMNELLASLA